jgi:hypothetical protein
MLFLRTLKATPRFLLVAPLFGIMVAMVVLAHSPLPLFAGIGDQIHPAHECEHPLSCAMVDIVYVGCKGDTGCQLEGIEKNIYTCRPVLDLINCYNNAITHGSVNCPGKCQSLGNPNCTPYTIAKCKNP